MALSGNDNAVSQTILSKHDREILEDIVDNIISSSARACFTPTPAMTKSESYREQIIIHFDQRFGVLGK